MENKKKFLHKSKYKSLKNSDLDEVLCSFCKNNNSFEVYEIEKLLCFVCLSCGKRIIMPFKRKRD